MTVFVTYFAILREQRGLNREQIETRASTYRDFYGELQERHGFTLKVDLIKAADRGEFVDLDSTISEGADIVFIPPVAGG
ncbi:MAG: MoaD/ThiS family protein [Fimbriimonadaceae bacterium]